MGIQVGMRPEWANLPQVHNSDLTLFQKCRRKWDWNGRHRRWLQPTGEPPGPLWFGSAFHYALEDLHGYKKWTTPGDALWGYTVAFPEKQRPHNWRELIEMGEKMLDYYDRIWLPRRKEFDTYWVDGVPQCEVDFAIKIPGLKVVFAGTFDRIVQDVYGRLWVLDWKTTGSKQMVVDKWQTDPQITRYSWAASQLYGRRFEGVIMVQFKKAAPGRPSVLKRIHKPTGLPALSMDKATPITYGTYYDSLLEHFGHIPEEYEEHLNYLMRAEDDHGDCFIRWDHIRRSQTFQDSEPDRLREVIRDYFNPDLRIYPNPTEYNCGYCEFRGPCLALDDGMDYESILEANYESRHDESTESWRKRLVLPDDPRYREPPRRVPRADDDMTNEEFMESLGI